MTSGILQFMTEANLLILREGFGGVFEITGVAIHPGLTQHPEDPEWVKCRKYFEQDLIRAAPTLVGKPIDLDHSGISLNGCKITESQWDTQVSGVRYKGVVTPHVADMIRNGLIKHVSVTVNWAKPGGGLKFVDGISPFGFEFEGLSLLRNLQPGDPEAFVRLVTLVEAITPESEEFFLLSLKDPAGFLNGMFSTAWIDQQQGVQGWFGRTGDSESLHLIAIIFQKGKGWTEEKIETWRVDHPQYFAEPELTQPPIQVTQFSEGLQQPRILTPSERWRKNHRV